jgi:hypothetical protein
VIPQNLIRSKFIGQRSLMLEAIALRHRITILEHSLTRCPCLRGFDARILSARPARLSLLQKRPQAFLLIQPFEHFFVGIGHFLPAGGKGAPRRRRSG